MKLNLRTDGNIAKKTWRIYVGQMKKERTSVMITAICIPLSDAGFSIFLPLLISFVTQRLVTDPTNAAATVPLIVAMGVVVLASAILNYAGFEHLFRHEERVTTRLTKLAMESLLGHSQTFFSNQKVGSLAGDVNTFSRSYMAFMDTFFMQASGMIVNIFVSLAVVAFIAPLLLVPLILLTGISIYQAIRGLAARAPTRNERKVLQSKLYGTIADILANQTLVRIFGRTHDEVKRLVGERQTIESVAELEITLMQRHAMYRTATIQTTQILMLILCVVLYSQSIIGLGAFIFVVTYLGRITGSIFGMNSAIRNIEQAFLDAAKITEILDIPIDVVDRPHSQDMIVESGAIHFTNVSFAYADARDQAVFHDLNLTIPAGQRVGLVGHSGGGKTTLTNLLLRYADIDQGTIEIDGQNIAHVTQTSLRTSIGYVPQDPFLFHRSVRDNIAYGKPDATDEEIVAAAKEAQAFEFIDEMPHGLDTIVGERGIKLSGGQRQRIAVARAILKDAPILLLDEATSALDSESERAIQQAFETLMDNRTSIVVAHRLSTIAKLDRILVLEKGRITEDGTHTELLAKGGTYARLWSHQSGGFIKE